MMRQLCLLALLSLTMHAQDAREAMLEAHLVDRMAKTTTPLDSPAVLAYVERTGQQLASMAPKAPACTFSVIVDDSSGSAHEAIVLPGGHIYIPGSLIQAAQTEAEFAGMLAHAIAHVAEHHGQPQPVSPGPVKWLWIPGQSIGPLALVKPAEREADQAAIRITASAGFDSRALLEYLTRVQAGPSADPERTAALREALGTAPATTNLPSQEYTSIRQEVSRWYPTPVSRAPSLYHSQH